MSDGVTPGSWLHQFTEEERRVWCEAHRIARDFQRHYWFAKHHYTALYDRFNALQAERRAPVNRLPIEVLFIIFDLTKEVLPNREAFQWTLARVCKRWRQLIMNDPRFVEVGPKVEHVAPKVEPIAPEQIACHDD
ncbi:hypothetical protein CALVIDRAFT_567060 [Calocera viscosa TUFC12733]|uniref:F-box domain-containing protein n=1 Tax=Calocera viscosa (strain TUFC12733) TaxID=1330018 RepID=A0A167ILP5_CALVF|nr:hypothetical protein CALVIDRAFT_567060 [Calocera viscosa TUFC12733]